MNEGYSFRNKDPNAFLSLLMGPQHNTISSAKHICFCQETRSFKHQSCKKLNHRTQKTVSLSDPLFDAIFLPSFLLVYPPEVKLHWIAILLSQRKVIFFFLFCNHPFVCCVNVSFTAKELEKLLEETSCWGSIGPLSSCFVFFECRPFSF